MNKILAAILAVLVVIVVIQTKRLDLWKKKHEDVAAQLKLKEGELAKIRIDGSNVASNSRNGGPRSTYRPPEGRVDVTLSENKKLKEELLEKEKKLNALGSGGNPEEVARLKKEIEDLKGRVVEVNIHVQRWGFVLRPGIGAVYAPRILESGDVQHLLLPEIDFKLFFFDRYSAKIGATLQFVDLGITRHIDDLVPFLKLENLEIQAVAGLQYSGGYRLGAGIRVNL